MAAAGRWWMHGLRAWLSQPTPSERGGAERGASPSLSALCSAASSRSLMSAAALWLPPRDREATGGAGTVGARLLLLGPHR